MAMTYIHNTYSTKHFLHTHLTILYLICKNLAFPSGMLPENWIQQNLTYRQPLHNETIALHVEAMSGGPKIGKYYNYLYNMCGTQFHE